MSRVMPHLSALSVALVDRSSRSRVPRASWGWRSAPSRFRRASRDRASAADLPTARRSSCGLCYELLIDIRSQEFLDQFYNLFATYRTDNLDDHRLMYFGNEKLIVTENPSTTTRYRSFKFTLE